MPDLAAGAAPRSARWRRAATNVAFAAFVAALGLVAWPARLGGPALFVIVHGTSMEPTYQPGDLLYARTTRQFEPGQVAIYRIPDGRPGAGELVVHRIEGRTADGRYVMQGDNRPLDDGALPTAGDLVARPLADLGPGPVTALRLVPWAALAVVGATLGWYLWPTTTGAGTRTGTAGSGGTGGSPGARPLRPAGVDLRGTWALVRDASVGHRPLPPLTGVDPFAPTADPLSLGDLLRFLGTADQVQVG